MGSVQILRRIALVEGISMLALVLIAMPLKYVAHMPLAVRIAGSVHGFLFVVFVIALAVTAIKNRWPLQTSLGVFVAALIPGGVFFLDRVMRDAPGSAPAAASTSGPG